MGYSRAGFEVVGVDIAPQPRYPFEFHRGDAIEVGAALLATGTFAAVHASPPCQAYSVATRVHGAEVVATHPDLVAPTRALLAATGLPFIIENVPGAPLHGAMLLCGSMFGLEVRRHRIFEGVVPVMAPFTCNHTDAAVPVYGHTGAGANRGRERERGRSNGVADWKRAMDIDWMTVNELAEAIPPAYTAWLGAGLLAAVLERGQVTL